MSLQSTAPAHFNTNDSTEQHSYHVQENFHLRGLIQKDLKRSPRSTNHRHLRVLYTSFRLIFAMVGLSPEHKPTLLILSSYKMSIFHLIKHFIYPFQMQKFSHV